MASWLARAEELLEKADRRVGSEVAAVKEVAGIHSADERLPPQPAAISDDVAALLTEAQRRDLGVVASAPATDADDAEAAVGTEGDDAPATAAPAHRVEWDALQQELQVLHMHGARLRSRLDAAGKFATERVNRARSAEAAATRRATAAEAARRAAEESAAAAAGGNAAQAQSDAAMIDSLVSRASSAEAASRDAAAEAAAARGEAEACASRLAEAEASVSAQTAALSALGEQRASEAASAEAAAFASAARIEALEARVHREPPRAPRAYLGRISGASRNLPRRRARPSCSTRSDHSARRCPTDLPRSTPPLPGAQRPSARSLSESRPRRRRRRRRLSVRGALRLTRCGAARWRRRRRRRRLRLNRRWRR